MFTGMTEPFALLVALDDVLGLCFLDMTCYSSCDAICVCRASTEFMFALRSHRLTR